MDGLEINGIALFLGHVPSRKSLCFYFVENGTIYPVGYVSKALEPIAREMWQKMLGDDKKQ